MFYQNSTLGPQQQARQNKEKAKVSKKKGDLHKLVAGVKKTYHQQAFAGNLFLTNKSLKKLIVYKRQNGDKKSPSKKKEDLLAH